MGKKKDKTLNVKFEESIINIMGFDKYDVINLTKEEFIEKKLPLISLIIETTIAYYSIRTVGSLIKKKTSTD